MHRRLYSGLCPRQVPCLIDGGSFLHGKSSNPWRNCTCQPEQHLYSVILPTMVVSQPTIRTVQLPGISHWINRTVEYQLV